MRTLMLLRHAEAVASAPGHRDEDRPLTEGGVGRAGAVGDAIRAAGSEPDLVITSSALRTRQTADALGLGSAIEIEPRIYNAGSDSILEVLHEVTGEPDAVLVVGHAPGIPALAHDLADPESSAPDALAAIAQGFPTATLCRLEFDGAWDELRTAALVQADPGIRR